MIRSFKRWKQQQFELGNLKISRTRSVIVGNWKKKYNEKKGRSKRDNIPFELSFDEYLYKCFEVKMKDPTEINTKSNGYNLSRLKDIGPYSINNCRFISHKQNMRERNIHFNCSKNAKRQVKDGKNALANGLNKRLILEGKHHLVGREPWENTNKNSSSLEVWYNAELVYNYWNFLHKCSYYKVLKKFNFSSDKACRNLIKKFKNNWNPKLDNKYLEWTKNYVVS